VVVVRRRGRGGDLGFHIYGSTRACENDRRRQRPDWVRFQGTTTYRWYMKGRRRGRRERPAFSPKNVAHISTEILSMYGNKKT
jgi:hypothetical protein